jgi:hypothetical protein
MMLSRDRRQHQSRQELERRVADAAEAALAQQSYVSAIDVLLGLGWLAPWHLERWRQGRVDDLERIMQVNPSKLRLAMEAFDAWARDSGLEPSEVEYLARSRDHRPLRFSASGDPGLERSYRTHWVSPALSERSRARLAERQSRPPDLVVISPLGDWTCAECGGSSDLLLMEERGPICMTCADLDHLVFLPSGDATLTRRAKRASGLAAVVVRFSRARKRYERQGILVEEAALERAEAECLADAEARARRREREERRRSEQDVDFQAKLARAIIELYPGCPQERAEAIARHAGARGSGRVGRSAAARAFDAEAITLAVVASVRHRDTDYDELLMSGMDRREARDRVRPEVDRVLAQWTEATGSS